MKNLLIACIAIAAITWPTGVFAEDFEVIECGYTYYTHLHGESGLPIVTNYRQRGVIRSTGAHAFLNDATYYVEGMLTRPPSEGQYLDFEEGDGRYAIVIVDADGDMILGHETGDITRYYLGAGARLSGEFTDGTGKYQGIRGAFEFSRLPQKEEKLVDALQQHLAELPPFGPRGWHDHDMCNRVTGSYEIDL
ncbi:MAG: hypothetical protein QNJ22_06045 [Desulfosarcinaceae bacterium]|nr:hypothetical protein [Desulfosarcinaceae bacterium]